MLGIEYDWCKTNALVKLMCTYTCKLCPEFSQNKAFTVTSSTQYYSSPSPPASTMGVTTSELTSAASEVTKFTRPTTAKSVYISTTVRPIYVPTMTTKLSVSTAAHNTMEKTHNTNQFITVSSCKDKRTDCDWYGIQSKWCIIHPAFMKISCPYTCKFCKNEEEIEQSGEKLQRKLSTTQLVSKSTNTWETMPSITVKTSTTTNIIPNTTMDASTQTTERYQGNLATNSS